MLVIRPTQPPHFPCPPRLFVSHKEAFAAFPRSQRRPSLAPIQNHIELTLQRLLLQHQTVMQQLSCATAPPDQQFGFQQQLAATLRQITFHQAMLQALEQVCACAPHTRTQADRHARRQIGTQARQARQAHKAGTHTRTHTRAL